MAPSRVIVPVVRTTRSPLLAIPAASLLWACGCARASLPADPRAILAARVSRGVGGPSFDSSLVRDSLTALLLVQARRCERVGVLRRIAHDTAPGGRRLEQLVSRGLIAYRQGEACTTFPILINARQAAYATLTHEVAKQALRPIAAGLHTVFRRLDERGWKEWRYHFVWSELLDSPFVRGELLGRDLVPPLDQPVAWVIYPEHPFRSGTGYYPQDASRDYWLAVTWRAGAADTRAELGTSWELIYRASLNRGALSSEELMTLDRLGLLDAQAEVSLPVLQPGDSLLDVLHDTAIRYVEFLERRLPMDSLMALTGVARQSTFAMAYRDVGWWIMQELVRGGEVVAPPALQPGAAGDASLRGVAAVIPAYGAFADRLRAAVRRSGQPGGEPAAAPRATRRPNAPARKRGRSGRKTDARVRS